MTLTPEDGATSGLAPTATGGTPREAAAAAVTGPAPHKREFRARVWIGLIALAASLLGAATGAGATVYAANHNATTQEDVARNNFKLNQKQLAYSAYVTSINVYDAANENYVALLTTSNDRAAIEQSRSDYRAAADAVNADVNTLSLVASDDVFSVVNRNVGLMGDVFNIDYAVYDDYLNAPLPLSLPTDFGSRLSDAGSALQDSVNMAVSLMRNELSPD